MSKIQKKYHIIIIGGGFSGTIAAATLADHGLTVLMVEENYHLGGQLLRKIPEQLGDYSDSFKPDQIKKIGFSFVENVKKKNITVLNKSTLIGMYDNNEILIESNKNEVILAQYEAMLFASGARERFLPFKGWTLPGVMSTGMLQVLIKSSGILPARELIIGGSGLFLFAAAYEYMKNGGKLLGIHEQSTFIDKSKFLPHVFHQLPKFVEGAKFLSKIYASGVPVKYQSRIVEARGENHLEEVVIAKMDADGHRIPGSEKVIKTNVMATGFGFVPNIEGPQAAGCALEFGQEKGGWVVSVNDDLETSVDNIFAAGETTGIAGALKSINEGKLAGLGLLKKFGVKVKSTEMNQLKTERKHHLAFMKHFNTLYKIPKSAILDIPDETVICRCENVLLKDIKEGINLGCKKPNGFKMTARTAMGKCQGRTCSPVIYDILEAYLNTPKEEIGLFTVRPPFKPVGVESLRNATNVD